MCCFPVIRSQSFSEALPLACELHMYSQHLLFFFVLFLFFFLHSQVEQDDLNGLGLIISFPQTS